MARRDVIEITCDRCGRTETQSSTEAPKKEGEKPAPEIEAIFHGEKLVFNDLCKRCREAVKGYFSRIAKKDEPAAEKAASVTPIDPAQQPKPEKRGFLGGR